MNTAIKIAIAIALYALSFNLFYTHIYLADGDFAMLCAAGIIKFMAHALFLSCQP